MVTLLVGSNFKKRFNSTLTNKKTFGGQLYAHCSFMPCGSDQI